MFLYLEFAITRLHMCTHRSCVGIHIIVLDSSLMDPPHARLWHAEAAARLQQYSHPIANSHIDYCSLPH